MCGRFSLTATSREIEGFMGLGELEVPPEPRYNIAPTQPIMVVAAGEKGPPGSNMPSRRAVLVRWGFIPAWVKDPNEFPLLINARAETAIEKASFRTAMRHRRVLVPASGFYEWHRPPKGSREKPQAYWVRPRHHNLIAYAGLMETWASPDGTEVDTGTILTAQANPVFARIHDRMPVVIEEQNFERWLDCKTLEPRDVLSMMAAAHEDFFEAIPVSDLVNKVANSGPEVQGRMEIPPLTKSEPERKASAQLDLF